MVLKEVNKKRTSIISTIFVAVRLFKGKPINNKNERGKYKTTPVDSDSVTKWSVIELVREK